MFTDGLYGTRQWGLVRGDSLYRPHSPYMPPLHDDPFSITMFELQAPTISLQLDFQIAYMHLEVAGDMWQWLGYRCSERSNSLVLLFGSTCR